MNEAGADFVAVEEFGHAAEIGELDTIRKFAEPAGVFLF
jgi:hypothetical protein